MEAPSRFFARFPTFTPNPSAPALLEFARLAYHMNWSPKRKRYHREWGNFIASEFTRHFGAETKLGAYQALYRILQLEEPVPDSITQCRKALARIHVNLVDLVDACRMNTEVHKFQSVRAMVAYTRGTGKAVPRAAAKENGVLKDLLRRIW